MFYPILENRSRRYFCSFVYFCLILFIIPSCASNNDSPPLDRSAPTVKITSGESIITARSPFSIRITFNEEVFGFELEDITVTNGKASDLVEVAAGLVYVASITPTLDPANVSVLINTGVVYDAAGNNNTASALFSIRYDSSVLTLGISSSANSPTNTSPIPLRITFSERVAGFTLGDIVVVNGVAGNLQTADDTVFTLEITPDELGDVTVDVPANVVADALTGVKSNLAATPFTIWYGGEINGSITGLVIDSVSLAPLAGVSVFLEGTLFMATTDADGEFSFTEVPAGYYILTASHKDYLDNSADVEVFASPENSFEVELNPAVILSTVANTGWFSELYPLADAHGTFAEVAIETPVTIDFASLAFVKAEIVFSAGYHVTGAGRVNTYINDAQQVYASTTLSGWWVGNNAALGTFLGEYYATSPSTTYTVDVTDFIRNNPNSVYYFAVDNLELVDVRMQNIQLIIYYR